MQALPPRHVYSAVVKNEGSSEIKVAVTYTFHDGSTEIEEEPIAAGGDFTFGDKTKVEGTMTTIAHITEVTALSQGNSASVTHPFNVSSPTRGYVFTVTDDLSIEH